MVVVVVVIVSRAKRERGEGYPPAGDVNKSKGGDATRTNLRYFWSLLLVSPSNRRTCKSLRMYLHRELIDIHIA